MPGWATEGEVAVGVDPYMQPARQEEFFGLRLSRMGVLPVQLLIHNDGDRSMLLRSYEIVLRLPDGRALAPVTAAQAVARAQGAPVQFSSAARSAVYSAPVAGAYAGPQAYGAASGVTVLAGVVLAVQIGTQRELHRQLFADYRAKELGYEVMLRRHESRHGFVYFILPPDVSFPADVTLVVRLIDAENATGSVVEVPLPPLDFRGPPTSEDRHDEPHDAPRR